MAKRRVASFQRELLLKSREAALAAVQIFNNPQILFKSELFIVSMNIAWTYLLHAWCRKERIDYRYHGTKNGRKVFDRTKSMSYKYWELERCLNWEGCPVDKNTANNLRFLIGIRHEIEHQMTSRIDDALSAKFQACCLNYNHYVKKLFGEKFAIDKHLTFSLQFSAIERDQAECLRSIDDLPKHIGTYIKAFETTLTEEEYASPQFAYRMLFTPKTVNHKGQADEVIEFVKTDSPLAEGLNKTYALIKEVERPKHRPSDIIRRMKEEGFVGFAMQHHTELWRRLDARADGKGFGVQVAGTWLWYDTWVEQVRQHCRQHHARRPD